MTIDSSAETNYRKMVASYLHCSSSSMPDVVCDFTQAITKEYIKHGSTEQLPFFELWYAILGAAFDTADEFNQEKLVSLVAGIKQKAQHRSEVYPATQDIDWTSLPEFGMVMRYFWNKQPPEASAQSWTNINAFAARCTAAKVSDFILFGIWTMRDALETKGACQEAAVNEETGSRAFLPAALEWLEHCGLILAKTAKNGLSFRSSGRQNDPAWLGELASASGVKNGGCSIERWNFWKSRLEELGVTAAGGPCLLAETPELADQGLQKMWAAEISMLEGMTQHKSSSES